LCRIVSDLRRQEVPEAVVHVLCIEVASLPSLALSCLPFPCRPLPSLDFPCLLFPCLPLPSLLLLCHFTISCPLCGFVIIGASINGIPTITRIAHAARLNDVDFCFLYLEFEPCRAYNVFGMQYNLAPNT
jgi:hypothetical protein